MDINKFIEDINASVQDEVAKTELINFAEEAKTDDVKAEALELFVNNFRMPDNYDEIDPELYEVPSYAIKDFYNDFIGNGTEMDPEGDGIEGSNPDA